MNLDFLRPLDAFGTPLKEGILFLILVGIVAVVWFIYVGVVCAMQKLGASSHKAKNWCISAAMIICINLLLYGASFWSPEALKLTWTINFFVLSTVVHFFVMEKCVYIKNIPSGGTAIAESLSPDNEEQASSWHFKLWCGGAAIFLALSCVVPCNIPLDIGWACQILATLVAFAMNKDLWDDGNWIGSLMPMQHAILHVMCCMSPIANTQLRHDLFKIWRGSTKRSTRDSLCENLEKLLVLVMIVSHACCTEETRYKAVASIFWTLFRGLTISSVPMSLKKIYGDGLKWIIMVVFVCFVFAYKDLQVECGFPDDDNIEINVGTVKVGGDNVHVHLEVTWTAQNWQTPNIDPINIEYFNQWKLNKVAEGILEPQLPWHILYKNNSTHKCELNVPHLGLTLASTAEKTFPLQWILLHSRWSTPLDMVKDWDLSYKHKVVTLRKRNKELTAQVQELKAKINELTAPVPFVSYKEQVESSREQIRLKDEANQAQVLELKAKINELTAPADQESYQQQAESSREQISLKDIAHQTQVQGLQAQINEMTAPEGQDSYQSQVTNLNDEITQMKDLIKEQGFDDLSLYVNSCKLVSRGRFEQQTTINELNAQIQTKNTLLGRCKGAKERCKEDADREKEELTGIYNSSLANCEEQVGQLRNSCDDYCDKRSTFEDKRNLKDIQAWYASEKLKSCETFCAYSLTTFAFNQCKLDCEFRIHGKQADESADELADELR